MRRWARKPIGDLGFSHVLNGILHTLTARPVHSLPRRDRTPLRRHRVAAEKTRVRADLARRRLDAFRHALTRQALRFNVFITCVFKSERQVTFIRSARRLQAGRFGFFKWTSTLLVLREERVRIGVRNKPSGAMVVLGEVTL